MENQKAQIFTYTAVMASSDKIVILFCYGKQSDESPDTVKCPGISPTFSGTPTHAAFTTACIYCCHNYQYITNVTKDSVKTHLR